MKPQLQSGASPLGNCLSTAIACLLNECAENVPDFTRIEGTVGSWPAWYKVMGDWLAVRGLAFLEMTLTDKTPFYGMPHETLCLLSGDNPAGQRHVVVGKIVGTQTVMIFDPSPSKQGITNVDSVCFLVPLDPALIHDNPTLTMGEDMTMNVHKDTRWIVQPADYPDGSADYHFSTEKDALDFVAKRPPGDRLKVIRTLTSVEFLDIPREASASAFKR